MKTRYRMLTAAAVGLCTFGVYQTSHAVARLAHGPSGQFGGQFDYPGWSLAHFVPAGIFVLLLPFQLWAGWRERHRKLHRVSGRVALAAAAVAGASGFALPYAMPERPAGERIFMTTFSLLFVFFAGMTLRTARRREFAQHRRWAMRLAAVGLAPMTQRAIFPIFVLTAGIHGLAEFWDLFVTAAWMSAGINLTVAEWWMRAGGAHEDARAGLGFGAAGAMRPGAAASGL